WIEKTWQATFLMAYASVDAGTAIGVECHERKGYHVNDAELWIEIVDLDEEGYGEVVFTTLSRTTMPLIRYRTRDIARLVPLALCLWPARKGRCENHGQG